MKLQKLAIIIPTYNEKENVIELITELQKVVPKASIFIVDDDSPDGTANVIRKFARKFSNIYLISRAKKSGRGGAVLAGFQEAYEKKEKFEYFLEMDADFSHDPDEITRLTAKAHPHRLVIGSRYTNGSKIINWPKRRIIMSALSNMYIRKILGLTIRDCTNGYRLYPRSSVEIILKNPVEHKGFITLSETAFLLQKYNYSFIEVPITFRDRKKGQSNATIKEVISSLFAIIQIKLRNRVADRNKDHSALQFLTKHFWKYMFFLLLLFITWLSYGKTFELFYWRDDWIYLWGLKYYPGGMFKILTDFYGFWPVRTGLAMIPYVYSYKLVTNSFIHQFAGLILKYVSVLMLYYFTSVITKKKITAVIAALLYASSSIGLEAYGWHLPTALSLIFALFGFIYFQKYYETSSRSALLWMLFFFILVFLSYTGRAVGVLGMILLWSGLQLIHGDHKRRTIVIAGATILVSFVTFLIFKQFTPLNTDQHLLMDILGNIKNYFASIGNAIRNPFFKIEEIGALTGYSSLSAFFGVVPLVLLIIGLPIYFKKNNNTLFLTLVFASWIYVFFITNWIYGGGSINTIVGSTNRYIAVSGIGIILLEAILLSKLNKYLMIICILLLIYWNLSYSSYVVESDFNERGQPTVEHIYTEISAAIKDHTHAPTILVIDSSGVLKTNAIEWSGPYPYAYYDKITNSQNFPTVIADENIARQWLCADSHEKNQMDALYSITDYNTNSDKLITSSDIFAWHLNKDGTLSDQTTGMRDAFQNCHK